MPMVNPQLRSVRNTPHARAIAGCMDYFCRKTMRPLVRSYGDSSTFTRSPGRMRMKCLRILPETMPRISLSELSSLSLNMALGNACETVASISMGSDLATNTLRDKRGLRTGSNDLILRTNAAPGKLSRRSGSGSRFFCDECYTHEDSDHRRRRKRGICRIQGHCPDR